MNPKHPIAHKVLHVLVSPISLLGLLNLLIIYLYVPDMLNSFLFLGVIHILSHYQSFPS